MVITVGYDHGFGTKDFSRVGKNGGDSVVPGGVNDIGVVGYAIFYDVDVAVVGAANEVVELIVHDAVPVASTHDVLCSKCREYVFPV